MGYLVLFIIVYFFILPILILFWYMDTDFERYGLSIIEYCISRNPELNLLGQLGFWFLCGSVLFWYFIFIIIALSWYFIINFLFFKKGN